MTEWEVRARQMCPACLYVWVAVYPGSCRELECPECGVVSKIPTEQAGDH